MIIRYLDPRGLGVWGCFGFRAKGRDRAQGLRLEPSGSWFVSGI